MQAVYDRNNFEILVENLDDRVNNDTYAQVNGRGRAAACLCLLQQEVNEEAQKCRQKWWQRENNRTAPQGEFDDTTRKWCYAAINSSRQKYQELTLFDVECRASKT